MKHKLIFSIIFCAFLIIANNINISFAMESNLNNEITKQSFIKMEYEYDEETNLVTAKIVSNIELKHTKPTWILSSNKKMYTKVFAYNTKYTTPVEDINGNIMNAEINITQIDENPAKITMEYEYKEETNTVIATMKSDKELQDTKISWKLSNNKREYTFEFGGNTRYVTNVIDRFGNIIPVQINVTQIKKATITTKYEYDTINGQIIAKIISDIPLKDTKPTWKLSEDRKTYTKVFTADTHYTTPVEDISGNIIIAEVNVKMQVAKITVEYKYNEETNQVIAKIISDIPLKDTKPTWTLSENRLTYTKIFTDNIIYSTPVEDVYGNIINVYLNIESIDLVPPEITVQYEYNDDDETVTVYMKSNEEFGTTKINWILSEDKKIYKFTFNSNQNYNTVFQDTHGNQTNVKINFKMKKFIYDENKSTITVRYLYIGQEKVNVAIISSVKMIDTKPTWNLSDDGYTYTKTFYGNQMYKTPIQNVNGQTIDVNIIINMFGDHLLGIDVSKWQGEIDWNAVKKQGIDIAIPRIGYGREAYQKDATFEANYSGAKSVGIKVGTYIYSYATDVEGAKLEAYNCLNWLNGRKLDLPVFYDLEDDSQAGIDKQTITNMAKAFCEILYNAGYKVGVYANKYWLQDKIDVSQLPDYCDIWLAHYTGTTDPINNPSDYKENYQMWQYTSTGKINGISGDVDMNICYKKY